MSIDKNHPKYPAYSDECKKLADELMTRWGQLDSEFPDWRGKDHPNGERIKAAISEYSEKLKCLQRNYGVLSE